MSPPLLEARGLSKRFGGSRGFLGAARSIQAVDGVDLAIPEGRVVGLVGESGCGKTTLGRLLLGLVPASDGERRYRGRDASTFRRAERRALRGRLQAVVQDAHASLNPRMRVRDALREPLRHVLGLSRRDAEARVRGLLQRVGLPAEAGTRLPHALSGGQRQRVAIARALATGPEFLLLDEPTSALDVSVQAQILDLVAKLRREMDLTCLLVSHDLSVVRHVCDEVAVMHAGRIVEQGPVASVLGSPAHPATRRLLDAVPVPDPGRRREPVLLGEPMARSTGWATGCAFADLCPRAEGACREHAPTLVPHGLDGASHRVACHHPHSGVENPDRPRARAVGTPAATGTARSE